MYSIVTRQRSYNDTIPTRDTPHASLKHSMSVTTLFHKETQQYTCIQYNGKIENTTLTKLITDNV